MINIVILDIVFEVVKTHNNVVDETNFYLDSILFSYRHKNCNKLMSPSINKLSSEASFFFLNVNGKSQTFLSMRWHTRSTCLKCIKKKKKKMQLPPSRTNLPSGNETTGRELAF